MTLAAALLLTMTTQAQIIVTADQWGGGVVTTTEKNSVSEDDYSADGIIQDWKQTLREFEKFDGASKIDLEVEKKKPQYTVTGNIQLPQIIDENGIDLFLLTKDGITIYMAMDAPVYLQYIDDDLVKWVRYYAYQKREHTKRIFARYGRWEQKIKDSLHDRGVPQEVAELCMVESGCTYEAISSAGAVGLWQIMPETGRAYQMTINQFLDERKDPNKSTTVACKILQANYKKIGEWTLAIAAYNCGSGRILTQIKKGHVNWSTMRKSLPKETQQYIPSLLAIHYVWTYREKLNL